MKKYVKPELIFERFELSQQIAACAYDSQGTNQDVENCSFEGFNKEFGEFMTIFMDTVNGCDVITEDYCYYGSTGGYFGIFNS